MFYQFVVYALDLVLSFTLLYFAALMLLDSAVFFVLLPLGLDVYALN